MSKRILYFDVLNVAACLAVIIMHFNGLVHAFSPSSDWLQALFAECVCYWAVPIFFMLSGANLLTYRERYSTKEFLYKRFVKTVIPFLAWSALALIWKVQTGQMQAPAGPRSFIDMVINTQIIDVYWFFIPLFSMYLSFPVLSFLCDGKHDDVLWYSGATGCILISVLPSVSAFLGISFNSSLTLPILSGNLLFAVLGYLIKNHEFSAYQRYLIYFLGVMGFAVRYFSTAYCSFAQGELYTVFWGVTNFPCMLLSVAVFVFCKYAHWDRLFTTPRRVKALKSLSGCSFGIYLIHMIVFYYLLIITGLDGGRLVWRTVFPFICYFVCAALVFFLKKIPLAKWIVP